jgi:hypothetical protein
MSPNQKTSRWSLRKAAVKNYAVDDWIVDTPATYYATPKYVTAWHRVEKHAKEVVQIVGTAVQNHVPSSVGNA